MDVTVDGCGAEVIAGDHPNVVFTELGQEPVSAVFKPLQSGPAVNIQYSDKIELSDMGLPQDTVDTIQ